MLILSIKAFIYIDTTTSNHNPTTICISKRNFFFLAFDFCRFLVTWSFGFFIPWQPQRKVTLIVNHVLSCQTLKQSVQYIGHYIGNTVITQCSLNDQLCLNTKHTEITSSGCGLVLHVAD